MSKKLFIFISILALGVVTFFYIRQTRQVSATSYNPQTDQLVTPKYQPIAQTLRLAGSVDALSKANLRFTAPGLLSWVGVKVGDRVKRYQALATLDRRQLQKQLEREANNYRSSLSTFLDTEANYQETKDKYLLTDEIKRILERNQNTLNNAVIGYELTELSKQLAVISSPIAGIVTQVDQPFGGVNVSPTDTFQVVDPGSVYFRSELDQEDLSQVSVGLPATISIDSYPDDSIPATLDYVSFSPIAGVSNIVYEVRFALSELKNDNLKYRLGLTGDATITLATNQKALTVPLTALIVENDANFVWTTDSSRKLTKTPVTLGLETDERVEITEGLTVNDQVVIRQSE
ncbi:MAG: efflux RND transporter periplasmic adaptor subunit [Candidatus Shapirobacteria bacterium]